MKRMRPTEIMAGLRDMEYDRELEATPEGRRSLKLRNRAQILERMDREQEAMALFQQAVALFRDEDNGAAAAAARHDLAHILSNQEDLRHLVTAEKLYRRAERPDARFQSP